MMFTIKYFTFDKNIFHGIKQKLQDRNKLKV